MRWLIAPFLALGIGAAAQAAEVPNVDVYANAPGWITVNYQHSGTGGVRGYTIEREKAGGVYTSYSPNGQYIDTHLTPDTEYAYRVCAVYDDEDEPVCSDWRRARTLPAPGKPAGWGPPIISDVEVAPDAIQITWGPTGDYRSILVRLEDPQGGSNQQKVQNVANGSFTFSGLRSGTRYKVILKGYDSVSLTPGGGPWSPDVFVTTPLRPEEMPPPPPPSKPKLTLTDPTLTTVALEFSVKVSRSNADDRFRVHRDGAPYQEVVPRGVLNGLAGSFTDTVEGAARHSYRVCFEGHSPPAEVCSDSLSRTPSIIVQPPPPKAYLENAAADPGVLQKPRGADLGKYAAAGGADTGGAGFAGAWSTRFGDLTLRQNGASFEGEYGNGGKVSGTVAGPVFTGKWSEPPTRSEPDDAGDVTFTLNGPNSFTGCWGYGTTAARQCDWSGTRK